MDCGTSSETWPWPERRVEPRQVPDTTGREDQKRHDEARVEYGCAIDSHNGRACTGGNQQNSRHHHRRRAPQSPGLAQFLKRNMSEWLIEMPSELVDDFESIGLHDFFMMIGRELV